MRCGNCRFAGECLSLRSMRTVDRWRKRTAILSGRQPRCKDPVTVRKFADLRQFGQKIPQQETLI